MSYRRFGDVAIERGFVSKELVEQALATQAERSAAGKPPKLIGQILLEEGHVTAEQIQLVLDELYPVE